MRMKRNITWSLHWRETGAVVWWRSSLSRSPKGVQTRKRRGRGRKLVRTSVKHMWSGAGAQQWAVAEASVPTAHTAHHLSWCRLHCTLASSVSPHNTTLHYYTLSVCSFGSSDIRRPLARLVSSRGPPVPLSWVALLSSSLTSRLKMSLAASWSDLQRARAPVRLTGGKGIEDKFRSLNS